MASRYNLPKPTDMPDWPVGSPGWEAQFEEPSDWKGTALPIHKPGTPEYESAVNDMADRIEKSYRASVDDPEWGEYNQRTGETFYHDAHGVATSLAMGRDPNSAEGQGIRRLSLPLRYNERLLDRRRPGYPGSGLQTSLQNPGGIDPRYRGESEQLRDTTPVKDLQEGIRYSAGTLARLSPQTEWELNIRQAHQAHVMDPDGEVMGKVRAHAAASAEARKQKKQGPKRDPIPGDLNDQPSQFVATAVDMAHRRIDPDDNIAQGPRDRIKIGSFYQNILNPDTSDYTTVDFRHHDIAYGRLLNATPPEKTDMARVRGSMSAVGRYRMIEEATKRAADRLNADPYMRLTEEPLRPHQVQAVAWWGDKNDTERRWTQMGARQIPGTNVWRQVNPDGSQGRNITRADLGNPIGQY